MDSISTSDGEMVAAFAWAVEPYAAADDSIDLAGIARAFQHLADGVTNEHLTAARRAPKCSACCHQAVPISAAEAVLLIPLLTATPAPSRQNFHAPFSNGAAYLARKIPCRFLRDGDCSIHTERPTVCREYLVSSDPTHCAASGQAQVLSLRWRPSEVLSRLCARLLNRAAEQIPLARAETWLRSQRGLKKRRWPLPEVINHLHAIAVA